MGVLDGIAATINSAFQNVFYDAVLTRLVPTAGPDAHTPGVPQEVDYPCKALREEYSAGYRLQGLVADTDFKIKILAAGLATVPEPGDRITIAKQNVVGTIVPANTAGQQAVKTDPATAVWDCRAST